ncbi:MAG: flagellar biosynthesis protein FlhA [Polyangiaceae bacterium]
MAARSLPSRFDLVVPVGIIAIVLMMVVPLPAFLLDVLLTISVALAIGIFLTALFIEHALEFSSFPSLVLVATLLRLSLNVATTRLILGHGGDGHGAAGEMVEAFGRLVVGGNIVVGLAVFLILVVINFVVITKGAGRVAEVGARFTLDAMPGKQMAIDADLSSGLIAPEAARKRRQDLEREADFFGAMDGASKFVHGDAIAGLLITAINLIGGLILGVSAGMDVATAADTFSALSVGDALLSQIPALLVSAASGIVVTRSATGDQLGRALVAELGGRRTSVGITAGILVILGLLPNVPGLPCFVLAGVLAVAYRRLPSEKARQAASPQAKAEQAAAGTKSAAAEIDEALGVELLSLELGYELLGMVDGAHGGTLLDRVSALRREIAEDCGVIVPPVHVCDNLDLPPTTYRVLLLGNEIGRAECRPGRLLAIDSSGTAPPIDGELTRDPAFNAPARWVLAQDREMGEALGYSLIDHSTVVATHLGELLRQHAAKMLGRQEIQHLLDVAARTTPKLVDDVVPNLLPLGDVARVLRNLVTERISIRDMRSILEALADLAPQTKDSEQLTELVRERLAPQITSRVKGLDGTVTALTLDPRIEDTMRRALREIASGGGAGIEPTMLRDLVAAVERTLGKFVALGAPPVLVAPPDLRRFARAVFERKVRDLWVLSFRELDPNVQVRVLETISLGPAASTNKGQGVAA